MPHERDDASRPDAALRVLDYGGGPTLSTDGSGHGGTPVPVVSRLAKISLIVSILGSPFVAGPLIFWSMTRPGLPPAPTGDLINLNLRDIPIFMITTTLLSLLAMGRVGASGGRHEGMRLAGAAFLISLAWWPA